MPPVQFLKLEVLEGGGWGSVARPRTGGSGGAALIIVSLLAPGGRRAGRRECLSPRPGVSFEMATGSSAIINFTGIGVRLLLAVGRVPKGGGARKVEFGPRSNMFFIKK